MAELRIPDLAGAYYRGQQVYQARQQAERENALDAFLRDNGQALMSGDQNALAAYAQYDPQAAFGLQNQRQQMDMERQRLDLTRRSTEAGMANDAARLQLAREEGRRQASEWAMRLDDRQRADLAAKAKQKAEEALVAYQQGPDVWDRWNDDNAEFESIRYEDAPMKIASALGAHEALMAKPEKPPEALRTLQGRAEAGGLQPGTPEYQDFMLKGPIERTEDVTQTFRPATPEEAAAYGASAGQIDQRSGRFYPAETRDTTSEGERKAAGMYDRMVAAEQTLDGIAAETGAQTTSLVERGLTGMGLPEGYVLSPDSQRVKQAQRDWVRAKLRLESGAVIGDEEMAEEIRTYFPQPGEDAATIEQKRAARQQAMEQVRTQGGRAVKGKGGIPQSAADAGIDPDLPVAVHEPRGSGVMAELTLEQRKAIALARARQAQARVQQAQPAPQQDFRGNGMGAGTSLEAALIGARQGVTFGFGDEMNAGVRAAGDWMRGEPYGEAYDKRLAHERGLLDQVQRENPKSELAGEIGGALLVPAGTAGTASTVTGAALRGAAVGGVSGAAYGAGNAEGGAVERAEGAAKGGALGALFGAGAGAVTYAGGRGLQRLMKRGAERPSLGTLRAAKDAAYRAVDDAGETFSQEAMAGMRDAAARAVHELDYVPETDVQTRAALTILDKRAEAGPQTIGQVDKVRQGLWKRYNATKEPGVLATIEAIDDMIASRTDTDGLMQTARAAHARFKKAELLEGAFRKAADQTASSGSGGNILNKYKQAVTGIINDPKRAKWFTPEEIETMRQMARGTVSENILRRIGKLSPDGNGLMLALNLLGGAQFGAGSLAVTGAASAAKAISDRGAGRAKDRIIGMVSGSPAEEVPVTLPYATNALAGWAAGN